MAKAIYNKYNNVKKTDYFIRWTSLCSDRHSFLSREEDALNESINKVCVNCTVSSTGVVTLSGRCSVSKYSPVNSPASGIAYTFNNCARTGNNDCVSAHLGLKRIHVIEYSTNYGGGYMHIAGTLDAGEVISDVSNSRGSLIGQVTLDYGSVSTSGKNSDGCWYTLVKQLSPPAAPAFLLIPNKVLGGKQNEISWGAASDADGDLSGYQLERGTNGGAYAQLYRGSNSSYFDPVAYGLSSVKYRVCAYDAQGQYGPYKESALCPVVNNNAPEITGTDTDLGVKTTGFSYAYTVSNAEEEEKVAVTVSLDNVELESFAAEMGREYSLDLIGERWITALNGRHTLSILAADAAGERGLRSLTFTKNVSRLQFQLTEPLESEEAAYVTVLNMTAAIPIGAEMTVELCNNGYDAEPVWEDATLRVKRGDKFFFENKANTAGKWGYNLRVTVERAIAQGECYILNIGGAFDYGSV